MPYHHQHREEKNIKINERADDAATFLAEEISTDKDNTDEARFRTIKKRK